MRANPGRKARRYNRFGHRQPTRMSEYARHRQTERERFDPMHLHLGLIDDGDFVELDEVLAEQAAAEEQAEHVEPVEYPGGHLPATDVREVTAYERAVLGALQRKPVYQHTVHADVKARRRKLSKAARRARRANRVAVALLMGFSVMFGAALHYAAPAQALDVARQVTVAIGWDDDTACVTVVEPNADVGRTALLEAQTCSGDHAAKITYLSRPGQWYGARVTARGSGLACEVRIGNRVVDYENAMDSVDCLTRW